MNPASLESFLVEMGVSRNPATLAAAIRFVQRAEGNFDCFGTADGDFDPWERTWRELLSARVRRVPVERVWRV